MALGNKNIMADNIQYYMDRRGIDRNTLCKDLGLPYMTVSDWLNAKSYPRIDKIELLANYFNIKKSNLVEKRANIQSKADTTALTAVYEQLEPPRQDKVFTYAKEQLKEQKLLQDKATLYEVKVTEKLAAGLGYSYQENNEVFSVYTDEDNLPNYDIASFITGDSMEPRYHDGDVALIQSGYDNTHGGIYAVDYDGKSFFKKVYFEGDYIRLVSLNKKYSDIIINLPVEPDTYLNIVGKVVGTFTPVEV
jgi:peptidase S24-like protein